MFGPSRSRELVDIERRMKLLERQLERLSSATLRAASSGAASVSHATDRVGEALLSGLSDLLDRFRGGARTVGDEASRFGHEAARYGQEAARLGNHALRRVSNEVEHRPLITLAVAVGIGLLVGMVGARRR